jgi:hypothetical protein
MSEDGYPTEEELERIIKWDGDFKQLLSYVKSVGHYWPEEDGWGWSEEPEVVDELRGGYVTRYHISTGGWSGNESIIDALNKNFLFWHMHWVQHRRGGHYIFEIANKPKEELA